MTKCWYNFNSKPEFILLCSFPHVQLFPPTVNHLASAIPQIFTCWLSLPVSIQLPIISSKSSYLSTWYIFVLDLTRHTGLPLLSPTQISLLLSWAQTPFANLLLLLSLPDGCLSTPHRLIHPTQAATSNSLHVPFFITFRHFEEDSLLPYSQPYMHGCLPHLGLPNDLY